MANLPRRKFLRYGGIGITAGLAGCTRSTSTGTQPASDATSREASADAAESSEFSEETREKALSVAKDVRKAVVTISGDIGSGGTAWFLDRGLLITNSHVVDHSSSFECWTVDGESFGPTLVGSSEYMNQPYHDVAVLETDFSPPNTLPLGESNSLEEGQPVVMVGHPFAVGNWVVSIGRYVRDGHGDAILSTAPNLSGNSGSPVVTLAGDVVGLTTGGVPRERSGRGGRPEPASLKLHEKFTDYQYTTSDTTDVIRQYVEKYE